MNTFWLFVLIVLTTVIYNSAYSAGKRDGSRKGYGVGFDRGRRRRNQSGCLIFLVGFGLLAAAGVAAAIFP